MFDQNTVNTFIVSPDPRDLIASNRTERPWEQQDVALLIVSEQVTQVALILPKRAVVRGAHHVRMPPQAELGAKQTYMCVAKNIASKLIRTPIRSDQYQFIGSARGNARRRGHLEPYGKLVHWVAVQLNEPSGVLLDTAQQFKQAHWWHINQILAAKDEIMSPRKCQMMMEALALLNGLGVDGQLTRCAKAEAAA